MELKGFVRKFGKGDAFDPLKDSKLNGDPIFPEFISLETPKCDLCSSPMCYLMQLSLSQSHSNGRIRLLFVYYCTTDVKRDEGWKIYRYSAENNKNEDPSITFGSGTSATSEPVFGDMNAASSWIDGLTISSTKTAEFNDGSMRVIFEDDVVYDGTNSDYKLAF
ncbi:conserved hypothetical protein [Theileria orientalis strain Shintoku]|uniref:Uncharacterized protein n=1 Tax=Theileria orientalis strain Shintoku TaxID=869250 RepID=J4DP13_THEOR|nr:conserved hypothetical protein [Theileria orientalis strain Shintoku]BAM39909.1 conserved hypothetical protein [Theileria orientalis strain Shintoku]|eukprot:XP_009690210.1 conserved hypothetical protein [Theileria orientalis strain Shintoku]